MLVAESVNWIKMMNSMEDIYPVSPRDDNLRLINQYLQIALSVIIFLFIFPTFWVANRVTKDFGWDVYKKIGSSIKIQANTVYIIVTTFSVATSWYAYMMYSVGVLIAAVATVSLAVKCQLNFGKGLKDFVQWHPWKKDKSKRRSAKYNSVHEADDCYGVYDRRRNIPVQILLDHALYAVEEAIATFREAVVNIDRLIEDNWEIVARETRQICNTNTTPRASITEQPDGDEIEAPKWSAKGINSVVDYI
ncbi:hypothetical protein MUCCIDRAFT_163258 [Mucor lusitanicus CBS 277.49]|uniref:Uncharacterized protein n=1 Tax=Mucor lusitanicus CBS 277.49 TaxID=747725 RepID=A0A168LM33_MUCCL|nr:hypothetical protein MUCCIDRAFT_163258 [Mucor lusitanicus CBS 277.49]